MRRGDAQLRFGGSEDGVCALQNLELGEVEVQRGLYDLPRFDCEIPAGKVHAKMVPFGNLAVKELVLVVLIFHYI